MKLLRISIVAFLALSFAMGTAEAVGKENLVVGIDISGSMRGPALEETIKAANEIVGELGGSRNLEIYTFTQELSKVDQFTSLSNLSSGGYTALYDSILNLSIRARELNAPLIVLTDGKDSRSKTSSAQLIQSLSTDATNTYFIAYNPSSAGRLVMEQIASNSGGKVFGINELSELIEAFSQAVSEIEEKSVRESEAGVSTFGIGIIASSVGIITLSILKMLQQWRRREIYLDSWSEVLEGYEQKGSVIEKDSESSKLQTLLTRSLGDTTLIAPKIKAQSKREIIFGGLFIGSLAFLIYLGIPIFISVFLAALATGMCIRYLVKVAEARIRLEFERDLPTSLRLLASSLTAGLSFLQALDTFSSNSDSRVALEFRRALTEVQMGAPIERALSDVARRMLSEDLKWVVFAFSIQREVGGGLAKILQTSADTIDSRSSLRQEMRTLSTEGRISSYILMLLPPGIFLFLAITRRDFISLFWQESIGHLLLFTVIILMTIAWVWIRRLVNERA